MTAPTPLHGLQLLLRHEQEQRDQAAARLGQAEAHAQRAREQAERLLAYRADYEARWSGQFRQRASIEIVHCYRSFMQRIDQALAQQARAVESAEARRGQARVLLLGHEQRCAAVGRLLERRDAELQQQVRRREQKHGDELAQRMHWAARVRKLPVPS
jgi:flagellar FliJ protein